IRKLEAWQHRFVDGLQCTIGLFCLWAYSLPILLKYLSTEYNVKSSEIQRLDLTDKLEILTTKGTFSLSFDNASNHILNRCKTCSDFSAELSDISVGGAGSLDDWSAVIIRTKRGEELFSGALDAGVIRTMNLEGNSDVFVHIADMALHKKDTALKNVDSLKRERRPIPPAVSQPWEALPREFFALASQKISDVMTKNVMTIPLDITISQLIDRMTQYHHLGYPVVDDNGDLCGVVTFEDTRLVTRDTQDKTLVKSVMKKDVIVDFADEPVFKAFERMIKYDIGRIVIVDRNNSKKIVGIITRSDLLRALQSLLK
ncbi:MAG: coenzyme hydrogenase subunit beta, partial [Thermoproteota archaeon]|nr:coenzyme hydrogenase subunit beta [Thermoproteota archaeon]